jgi:hypothetical protein
MSKTLLKLQNNSFMQFFIRAFFVIAPIFTIAIFSEAYLINENNWKIWYSAGLLAPLIALLISIIGLIGVIQMYFKVKTTKRKYLISLITLTALTLLVGYLSVKIIYALVINTPLTVF